MPLSNDELKAMIDTAAAAAVAAVTAAQTASVPPPATPTISAVAIKLPTFWTAEPEVWFTQVEAQFDTRNITADSTRFSYVVAALDTSTASEVKAVLLHPPSADRYTVLKAALIKAFGRSQAQKDNELLNLTGLGDRKPSSMLRHIQSLNADPDTLLRAVFLATLPGDVRRVLAANPAATLQELADTADRILEAAKPEPIFGASAVSRPKTVPQADNGLCFFHTRFGDAARNCRRDGCKKSHLVPETTASSGNAQAGR